MNRRTVHPLVIREQLGVRYERALTSVDFDGPSLRDGQTGDLFPVQPVPAAPFDSGAGAAVRLIVVDIEPGGELRLAPSKSARQTEAVQVDRSPSGTAIRNGRFEICLPADGQLEPPFPGPVEAFRMDGGSWFGQMLVQDVPVRGAVWTEVQSVGPCCVQWRTVYRWGGNAGFSFLGRWAAGADTIQVAEEIFEDSPAAIEWFPFGDIPAQAFNRGDPVRACYGDQEFRPTPMRPMKPGRWACARRACGRELLGYLSHIAYFNQWNNAWVGFTPRPSGPESGGEGPFAGIFCGWGSLWRRRGHLRIEIIEDDRRGGFVRFPLRHGRRLYSLVLAAHEDPQRRCLLNRRKTQLSDLRLDKVRTWELDPPLEERRLHLLREQDAEQFRSRLAADPEIGAALDGYRKDAPANHQSQFAAAFGKNDAPGMRAWAKVLLEFAEYILREVGAGGYERLSIHEGRDAKTYAYDLDLMWARGLIAEGDYRRVRRTLLSLAYMFADPDYCRYADFWPHLDDPSEGMTEALKDDMGDCPVPPNFSAEFFTTTAVVAELFERHPLSAQWREWGLRLLDRFLDVYYEPDGTYREAINYQTHCFTQLLSLMFPLYIKGVRNYFETPRVKGSFQHVVRLQMPLLANGIRRLDGPFAGWHTMAGWNAPRLAPLPANGNSSSNGLEMPIKGELTIGAFVYRETDPELSAHLMHAWRIGGKTILDQEHPLLILLTLDPRLPSAPAPWESDWRRSLGIVSKAAQADGGQVWCLFRAGRATHHMCFDQGNVHLAAWDSVLLGDYGYHCADQNGQPLPSAATWMHNTLVYSPDRIFSSGYTGLEQAPEPLLVHLGSDFDWVVHRIRNTNFRDFGGLGYRVMIPVLPTSHVRHYLFVKPDYVLLWDVFEEAHEPAVFWLHPHEPARDLGGGVFCCGTPGKPHLMAHFLDPQSPEVIESRQVGGLWSLGVRNDTQQPFLALLAPQITERRIRTTWNADGRTVTIEATDLDDTIRLPPPGDAAALPTVSRSRRRA